MASVATLHVEPYGNGLRYRLEVPERDVAEPLQAELVHPLDRQTVVALQQSAESLLRRQEGPTFFADAKTTGRVLYNTLVPSALREPLLTLSGPLIVSTSLYGLPWELLYDGEEFWGLRYALGKRIVMSRPLVRPVRLEGSSRPRSLIVGSDPRGDLSFVAREVERVTAVLEASTDITCVSGRMATFDAVTAYLGRGFDLIHYCGHVIVDPERGPGLLLADERLLTPPVIEANLAGRPLVFLNGCASVRGGRDEPGSPWEQNILGVSQAFLVGGAIAAIGTFCPVSDQHAATLAENFYDDVLEPLPIGEALRRARVRCRDNPASAGSPTWLSFVLYGNPAQLLGGAPAQSVRIAEGRQTTWSSAAEPPARALGRRVLLSVGLVIVAVALIFLAWQRLRVADGGTPRLVIGVMEVRATGAAVPRWMLDLTRDSLNAIFSHVPGLEVYSKERIDFERENRGLSEIAAAKALGMTKMISTTLSLSDPMVGIDVRIIDIASGLLNVSERVQGHKDSLIRLQNEIARKTLKALTPRLTSQDLDLILNSRTDDQLDSYKLLLETLGESETDKQSSLRGTTPQSPPRLWPSPIASAYAQEANSEVAAISTLLAQYAEALRSKDIDSVAALQLDMRGGQRNALMRYFENARELSVRISNIDVVIEGGEALATFTREDVFRDARSGRSVRLEVRITGMFAKRGKDWKIKGLRKPSDRDDRGGLEDQRSGGQVPATRTGRMVTDVAGVGEQLARLALPRYLPSPRCS